LLCENRFKSALEGYERLVEMKSELLKTEATDIVRSLVQLSMCHFALHQIDGAELALLRAGQYYHYLRYDDRDLLVQVIDALAGTLRHKAQFMQSDILEEAALELRGRSEQAGGHMLYGNLLKEAEMAESNGDHQTAKARCREALCTLEGQRQKRAVDRLHILAKLMLLTGPQQLVQRSSLHSDIEDSVTTIFCRAKVGTRDGIERIALIYDISGKPQLAANLRKLAEELQETVIANGAAALASTVPHTQANQLRQSSQIQGLVEIASSVSVPLLSFTPENVEGVEDVEEI
jgi:hypothetical protein